MQVIASFRGRNQDFRAWLAAGMPANVICLEMHRKKKKTARKRPKRKPATSIIPNEIA